MLFSSLEFIFLFLPLTGLLFAVLLRWRGTTVAISALALASVVFYGWWKPIYLPLFLGSVVMNYFLAGFIRGPAPAPEQKLDRKARRKARHKPDANPELLAEQSYKPALIVALALNLGLLFLFKYASFVSDVAVQAGILKIPFEKQLLPLGISFFTFTQITFLVDRYRGLAPPTPFMRYLLFVSFFPHLIAGPVLHHSQMMPQCERVKLTWDGLAVGLYLFAIGLAKKVVIADTIGPMVDFAFAHVGQMQTVHAWLALTGYAVQLYFDFSGYSDMAIGLGKMFGIDLPWNFESPYKCTNLAEFWRRWHMTLSNFFKDYIYIPLGGSQCGTARHLFNLCLTMLLGGIWHGAGWTFIAWGAVHGAGLTVHHLWRLSPLKLPRLLGWGLTISVVLLGWVFFRATSLHDALTVYSRLFAFSAAGDWDDMSMRIEDAGGYVLAGVVLALAFPNAKALATRYRPTLLWAAWTAALFALAMLFMLGNLKKPEFLYFNF